MSKRAVLLCLVGAAPLAISQSLPTNSPPPPPLTEIPAVRVIGPNSGNVVRVPPAATATPTRGPAVPANYRPLPDGTLAWNGETQEAKVKFGAPQAFMAFLVTNISTEPITITHVGTSCGCTVPKLPPMPWTLAPGTNGAIEVTMNLAGKQGTVIKTVTVTTDHGFKTLYAKTEIQDAPAGVMGESDRIRNLRIASANRQAVFQGDCVTCHVRPALNKMGAELYSNACAICHEAEHRASMVPDLKNLQKETNADYWRTWITSSAEGKLMPAFALENGGILNAMQIDSLVTYLVNDFPPKQQAAAPSTSAPISH